MNVLPVRLEGPTIRLEPLAPEHAPGLWPKAEPDIFRHTLEWPRNPTFEAFEDWIHYCRGLPNSLVMTIVLQETGEPVGMTGYLEIRPEHRALEIGRTWIGHAFQGSRVNPESKYLLLRHAFEKLEAVRVQFKTDLNNHHSQRAIEKLGAVREGVLRSYQVRSNGRPRDTVMYSVIVQEWPEVKARLEARLAAGPAPAPSAG